MKLLLDTHVFIWFVEGNPKLSQYHYDQITHPDNQVYLSVVSIWEAIIKEETGKLKLSSPADVFMPAQRRKHWIDSIDVDESSILKLRNLPMIHRDPFDRMLICQAQQHELAIATVDRVFQVYPVKTL